ncbi:GTP-binding protein [Streptomyces sp. NPDC090022]|uniref:GTP-binding protein n=1 Tax=Streptomyces sp. NPDC090022 TaxID=3365920 RepID=UPI0037F426F9
MSSLVWHARRPLHPGRLAEALGDVMFGVLRSRGHLWLADRPDTVINWRSAGPGIDAERITGALDAALVTDAELSLGRASWSGWTAPLFHPAAES